MSNLNEVLAAIEDFRSALFTARHLESPTLTAATANLGLRGILGGLVTPLQNVHATGVGVRLKAGQLLGAEFVIKVYVFQKLTGMGALIPQLLNGAFQGVDIDIEELPVLEKQAKKAATAKTTPQQHQSRKRPIQGGLEIQPQGASFVGTLGGIVRSISQPNVLFALSNNHVLADTNRLPAGTTIVQPQSSNPVDAFARLTSFEPIHLATPATPFPSTNRMDAAIARVTDNTLVAKGKMFGISNYTPTLKAPQPSMNVIKSGRTTAVTTGRISATRVNGVQVNYGTRTRPIIGTFDGCIQILGNQGAFSAGGDSGSFILEESTGQPVALLFAGNGTSTTACDLTAVCSRFNVLPV